MKSFRVVSMRRAGTHFLLHSLKENFKVGDGLLHLPPDLGTLVTLKKHFDMILIIRNPKDNLSSLYRFLKQAQNKAMWYPKIDNTSFSDWLRGTTPHEQEMSDRWLKTALEDPIKHWKDNSYLAEELYTVKYEDLKNNFERTMINIKNHYVFNRKSANWIKPKKVGPVGQGEVPIWSEDDLKLLKQKAGQRMKKLGYDVL